MKILITGFAGFVSKHFLQLLEATEDESLVIGIDRNDISIDLSQYKNIKFEVIKSDLKDKDLIKKIVDQFSPEYILHLASASSVFNSWQQPSQVFINNCSALLTILDAVKESNKKIRILSTGTSDVYGIAATNNPSIKESSPIFPANPYAASKASQEIIAKVYAESFGLDIIQTRSFTHFGPFQKDNFVLAKFARQMIQIKKGLQKHVLTTGNIDVIRDLTDVRDVAKAYKLLLLQGKSKEVYNVCSGIGRTLRSAIELMQEILSINIELKTDESLLRKGEIESIIGSNEKIKKHTGWQPEITFEKSINDLLDYWEQMA